MKKIAILQSNYIPWKGYFDIINMVDEFIIYDTVQSTKNDWRNRNKIKIGDKLHWLTIPIKHSITKKINEIEVLNQNWRIKHWKTISQNYSRSKFFHNFKNDFENLYLNSNTELLSNINYEFISVINKILGINTKISYSSDYNFVGNKSEALLNICKEAKANIYVSGPRAKEYLNTQIFYNNNIEIKWFDYSGYPEYEQLSSPFYHEVSIIDLIFNEGINSKKYMKSFF